MLTRLRDSLVSKGATKAESMTDAELSAEFQKADRLRRDEGGKAFALDPKVLPEVIEELAQGLARTDPPADPDAAS